MRCANMQDDLVLVCRDARARIEVPAVPLSAIRNAAALPQPRKTGWFTALIASISIVAIAAGAAALGTRVVIDSAGRTQVIFNAPHAQSANPTAADVAAAVQRANFPVTLPAGLPRGSQLKQLVSSNSAIILRYDLPGTWRASHHIAWIVLANPETVATSDTAGRMQLELSSQGQPIHWRIGGEEVIIAMHSAMTQGELAQMKQAMTMASTAR
jgi:hypothetical protein